MRSEIGIHTVCAALQHLSLWPFHWQACVSFTHDVDHWPLLVNSWRVPEYPAGNITVSMMLRLGCVSIFTVSGSAPHSKY